MGRFRAAEVYEDVMEYTEKDIAVYDYSDVPTVRRFALDNTRIRGLMGSFGCLSCDTEYLTPNGWKRFDSYQDGDEVAEFDLDTKKITFRQSEWIKLPCDSFLHLKNRYGIDQLLSDEHIVPFISRFHPGKWQTIRADELAERHNSLKDGWPGRIPIISKAPGLEGVDLTRDKLEFTSIIQAPPIQRVPSEDGFKYCFHTSTGYFIARRNGRIFVSANSGKSSGCVMELIRRAHEQRPSADGISRTRWAVIRNYYGQLRDTTIKTFFDWVPPHTYGIYKSQEHDYIITGFDGCLIEVMFRALDRPDQVKNLLSLELTGAWINEYREIDKSIFEALDGRILRYPAEKDGGVTWGGIFMDTNPPEEDSFWYNYFEKIRPDNAKLFKQPSGLSPMAENIRHLPRGYYTNLAKGKTEQYINVYIHGKYGYQMEGKLVYPSFNDSLHVASNLLYPINGRPLMLGFDFALNPTCVIAQMTPRGQLLVLDEAYGEGMGIENFLTNILDPLLQTKYNGFQLMGAGDPTGTSRSPTDETTCFQVLWRHGYGNINPASTNSVVARLGAVEGFLTRLVDGMPAFVLSPNCTKLRKGFNGGYRRKKIPGTEDYYDIPEKNHFSHTMDSLSYLCLEIGESEKHMERQAKAKSMERMMRLSQAQTSDSVAGY